MSEDKLKRIPQLFHFTDRRNLPLIRELGGLLPLATLRQMQIAIPAPGGNDWSHDADSAKGVDKYVHLCFRATHPMEFRAREDGRIVDSIFLGVHPDVLLWNGVRFCPDISNKGGVDHCSIDEARDRIDYEVLYTWTDWNDPIIKQRLLAAEKCEILVPAKIPLDLIRNMPHG